MSDSNTPEKPPFSKWLPSGDGPRKIRWYYLGGLLVVGFILMFVGTNGDDGEDPSLTTETENEEEDQSTFLNNNEDRRGNLGDLADLERAYAGEMEGALESINGVSNVEIVVNLESTESKVYEKDTNIREQTTEETDTEGGNRTLEESTNEETTVLVQEGDSEEPLLIRTEKPDVTGVLVVAEGVDQLDRKEWVIEAVTRTLDVPAHRVSVLPKQ
ncbi:stage III sporulation protein AG [Geomicrobium halophilum]|uniref:Stage III sporulation protein AG n=1 Tax=Geomicrobium halophilum TaxID=549000 RepID=A0A841PMH7_9BACL|nr:stage III sporulation protein AG [Geomicrobium halophilum]MBB6448924.1 stage III sporulation protein AG [Geomicrobium halophilum]